MEETVRIAFSHYHQLAQLAFSPLANDGAVRGAMLDGDNPKQVAPYAVQALLVWTLAQLRQDRKAWAQQSADVLQKRYVEGMSATAYADLYLVSDSTAQTRRRAAVKRATQLIEQELHAPVNNMTRRGLMLAARVADCTAEQQTVLRFLALMVAPVLPTIDCGFPLKPHLNRLIDHNLVIQKGRTIAIHPQAKAWMQTQIQPTETVGWHQSAARYFEKQHQWQYAIEHYQKAGEDEQMAALLIAHYQTLSVTEVQTWLAQCRQSSLRPRTWADLKMVAGRVAFMGNDVEAAVREYQAALSAPDPEQKARVWYELANAFAQTDTSRALAHYAACRRNLTAVQSQSADHLTAQSLMQEALIYSEQQGEIDKGIAKLHEAMHIIEQYADQWLTTLSDWHSFMGMVQYHNQQLELSADHYWQAWQFAQEAGDVARTIKRTFTLGQGYYHLQRYDKAREFFNDSLALAQQAANERMIAANEKGLGMCAFGQNAFDDALAWYKAAYARLQDSGHNYWLAATCYDIVEVSLHGRQLDTAARYWQEGTKLAQVTGNDALHAGFHALAGDWPEIRADLNERQQQAIGFIRANGSISNKAYRELFDCSRKSAENDLRTLVEQAILNKVGQGRSVRYEMKAATGGR